MVSMHTSKAIIFDLDGTLIDSSPSILKCFGRVLDDFGLTPLVPLSSSLIGPPLRQTLVNLTGNTDNAFLDRLIDGFKNCYDTEGYKETRAYDGVDAMLAQLADQGVPMAIATNKRRTPTLKIIEYLGWERYFRIVGTLDTPTPSYADKAAMLSSLLDQLSVSAAAALFIGDKLEDGEAAKTNSMPFFAAGWGYGEWDEANSTEQEWLYFATPEAMRKYIQFCL